MAKSADYHLGDYAFPRGWFVVAMGEEIGRAPTTVHYFGQDIVLYRGASGRVVALDAYCPHMGTHLGASKTSVTVTSDSFLEGDSIRCPFHAWRFGADGVCDHIPYFDGPIPPAARIRSWPVVERYGIVFLWHDSEGLEPDFDLPDITEWDDPDWVRWPGMDHLADLNHPIEIFDNNSDIAHLEYLHGGKAIVYETELEGHMMHQRVVQSVGLPEGVDARSAPTLTTISRYVGPGVFISYFVEPEMIELICHTPIEDGEARLWQTSMARAPAGADSAAAQAHRDRLNAMLVFGLTKDAEIWKNKRPAIHIMQMPTDGPFRQSRVWYSQFYNPRAKAESIVGRVAGRHFVKGMPNWDSVQQAAE